MEICPIVRSLFAMARTISGAAESPNPARYQTRGSDSKAAGGKPPPSTVR